MKSLLITRISLVTVYKLFFVGTFVGAALVFVVSALFDLGIFNITIQGHRLTKGNAILFAPIGALVLSPICTVLFGSSCVLGVWLWSLIRPMRIEVEIHQDSNVIE